MQKLFMSDEYKQSSSDQKVRRELIGNAIYEKIEKLIGSEAAPKVTGMIIDLTEIELIPAISTLENLKAKVRDANILLEHIKQQQEMIARMPAAPISGVPAANPAKWLND